MGWKAVEDALSDAKGIAWDGCHKIYVLMDEEQMIKMETYGYNDPPENLRYLNDPGERDAAFVTVRDWYEESCDLRFVNSVRTVNGDPNAGFESLIGQFEFEEEQTW